MPDVINEKQLSDLQELMGDKWKIAIQFYLEDAQKYVDSLNDGVAQKSVQLITSPAHTLKSSSQQVGADVVYEIARKIEADARALEDAGNDSNTSSLHSGIAQITAAFGDAKSAFEALL